MKNKTIKYILSTIGVLFLIIIYLSVFGLETEKFNNQIKNKVFQKNNKLDLKLKKIKLTLDLFNFKINAKTIGTKIIYQKKNIELEYIKTQISLISLIKNKFVSSNLKISTKSILLKDLVAFIRTLNNKPELFFLELAIKKGHLIADIDLNFDENGKIKDDYEINGMVRDGSIINKNYNSEKINFLLNIKKNIFNFQDLNFTINKMNLFSDNLKITQNEKDFYFTGIIENKNSTLNNEFYNLTKINFKNINLENINFSSKNNFSFKIDKNLKFKDLIIDSEIRIDEFQYYKPKIFNDYFPQIKDTIHLKDHKIKASYKNKNLSVKGSGQIQFEKKFDQIEYLITKKGKDFNFVSSVALSDLNIESPKSLKNFFTEADKKINLKNHKINIDYKKDYLLLNGSGQIQLGKEFDKINYSISKIGNKLNFDTKLDIKKTSLKINHLNYKKKKNLKTQIKIIGNYKKDIGINLNEASIISKDDRIILKNFSLNKENRIITFDKVYLDYYDIENKKNKFQIKRTKNYNYELNGSKFNGNTLISNLLKSKENKDSKMFINNINLNLNLSEVYIDEKNIVKKLNGTFFIKDGKVTQTNILAIFDDSENLTFTINTRDNGEIITTLFSSRAKPLVKRYNFIKGYEEGYLDFYSSKKNGISNSKLKIYNFKLQELPVLTKILTLASLQGIADLLSGEGIRFNEFEMNFNNKENLMTIDEIYAIGPAISILMSGYVEEDKLISLRGTLVPATTINKTISLIPLLGKILVGDKTGEGVFGVSFKIKGPPNDLVTTVNPIKTLTPRFITRTLEKINKN